MSASSSVAKENTASRAGAIASTMKYVSLAAWSVPRSRENSRSTRLDMYFRVGALRRWVPLSVESGDSAMRWAPGEEGIIHGQWPSSFHDRRLGELSTFAGRDERGPRPGPTVTA